MGSIQNGYSPFQISYNFSSQVKTGKEGSGLGAHPFVCVSYHVEICPEERVQLIDTCTLACFLKRCTFIFSKNLNI